MGQQNHLSDFAERLGPPPDRYEPSAKQLITWRNPVRWLKLRWFQYSITMGTYCFDWWERLLVHLFVMTVLGLIVYGLYKQLSLLLNLYPWSSLTRSYTTRVATVDAQLRPT